MRDALSTRDRVEVRAHLDGCGSCQHALLEVSDINQTMKLVIGPAVLGGLLIAGHYAAASGVAAGAAKGSILGHVTHIGHALKNPAIAATTVAATVAAAGIAAAGFYMVHTVNASDSKPSAGAAAAPIVSSANAPAKNSPAASPASITPSTNPAPSPSPTPTPTTSAPKTVKTTPKATTPVVVVPSVPVIPPVVPPVVPPPATYVQAPISVTPALAPVLAGIQFTVPSDWVITNIDISQPSGDAIVCPALVVSRRVVTCVGPALTAGEQDYTLTVAPASSSVTPAPGGEITWAYTDVNAPVPPSPLPSVVITTS